MDLFDDFRDFVLLLNEHGVDYMVVGGYALAMHGQPRYTGDLDIWIDVSENNATLMETVINDFGMGSLGLVADDFLRAGYITQIGHPPLRIDILNDIDGLTFAEARENRQVIEVDGIEIFYIGLHDFIRNKQASGRKQDMADIREIKRKLKQSPDSPAQSRGRRR